MYSIEILSLLVIAFCLGNITAPWVSQNKKNEGLKIRKLNEETENLKFQTSYLYEISSKFLVQIAKYDSENKRLNDWDRIQKDKEIELVEFEEDKHKEVTKIKTDLKNSSEKGNKYKKRAIEAEARLAELLTKFS